MQPLNSFQKNMLRRMVQLSTVMRDTRYSAVENQHLAQEALARERGELKRLQGLQGPTLEKASSQIAERESRIHDLNEEIALYQQQMDALAADVGSASRVADALLKEAGVDRDTLRPGHSGMAFLAPTPGASLPSSAADAGIRS